MESDFAALCLAIKDGGLGSYQPAWKKGFCCAPVAVAQGYPGSYHRGDPVTVDQAEFAGTGAHLFAAGALRRPGSGLITAGGRVLAVSALGANPDEAYNKAYRALGFVHFDGMDYRRDIGREN